jgi:hypothetical protein
MIYNPKQLNQNIRISQREFIYYYKISEGYFWNPGDYGHSGSSINSEPSFSVLQAETDPLFPKKLSWYHPPPLTQSYEFWK